MKISILHDEHGQIIATSKVGDLKAAGSKFTEAGMLPGKDERILEIELSTEYEGIPLLDLHKEHCVDLAALRLVKKKHE
jgi:hypothetical protein